MRTALLVVLLGICHSVAGRLGIINGDDAEENEYPFMVRLLYLGTHHYCGASLIRPNVVLTAAHCVSEYGENVDTKDMKVAVGDYSESTTGKNEQTLELSKIIVHEKYDSINGIPINDVALLILEEKVELKEGVIETVSLAQSKALYEEGRNVTVVGWGTTETGDIAETLQDLHFNIANQTACGEHWESQVGLGVQPGQVCVIDPDRESSAYYGDSGGPLVEKVGDKLVQIGLVSWGQPVVYGISYNMFTDVLYYGDWIEENAKGGGSDDDDEDEEECKFDVKDWIEITGITKTMKRIKGSEYYKGKITCELETKKYGDILDMNKVIIRAAFFKDQTSEGTFVMDMRYKMKDGKHLFTGSYWQSHMVTKDGCVACLAAIWGIKLETVKTEGPGWCHNARV